MIVTIERGYIKYFFSFLTDRQISDMSNTTNDTFAAELLNLSVLMSVRRFVVRFMLFIMSFYTSTHFRSVLGCPLRFPCSNDVRVVFTLICFVVVHISFIFMFSCSYSRLLVSNLISISDDVAVTNQTHTHEAYGCRMKL